MRSSPLYMVGLMVLMGWQAAEGQTAESKGKHARIAYCNRFSSGVLLGGESGIMTGSLTMSHGVAIGRWSLGAGTGVEGYERWRTMPVYGSLTYHAREPGRNGVYVQMNVGHSFGWWRQSTTEGIVYEDHPGGLMINPMIGYQLAGEKINVFLSAGYKHQRISYAYGIEWWEQVHYRVDEKLSRFYFQIGLGIR